MAHAAPPPYPTWLKKRSSARPSSRASAISAVLSMLNVTSPSTAVTGSPASASAASVASTASFSSLRPESLLNSVAPIPAMAAVPLIMPGCLG